jgi:hypothetical protein
MPSDASRDFDAGDIRPKVHGSWARASWLDFDRNKPRRAALRRVVFMVFSSLAPVAGAPPEARHAPVLDPSLNLSGPGAKRTDTKVRDSRVATCRRPERTPKIAGKIGGEPSWEEMR